MVAEIIAQGLEWVSRIAAACMMVLITADVLYRYAFSSSIGGAQEITSLLLLPAVIFFSLGSATVANIHVRVDLLYGRFSPPFKRLSLRLSHALAATFWGATAYALMGRSRGSSLNNEVAVGGIGLPLSLTYGLVAAGSLAMAITSALLAFRDDPSRSARRYGNNDPSL
jgi:TRAP-type C4-dicarboxylate transport system permease small subunit